MPWWTFCYRCWRPANVPPVLTVEPVQAALEVAVVGLTRAPTRAKKCPVPPYPSGTPVEGNWRGKYQNAGPTPLRESYFRKIPINAEFIGSSNQQFACGCSDSDDEEGTFVLTEGEGTPAPAQSPHAAAVAALHSSPTSVAPSEERVMSEDGGRGTLQSPIRLRLRSGQSHPGLNPQDAN